MDGFRRWNTLGTGVLASLLLGCASTGNLVDAPSVKLSNVQVTRIDLDDQTFLLAFEVNNPNPFPLPVRTISYGVELDGHRFASGETIGDITVPARSDGEFAISVDLNLLKTAPQLLFIVRDGVRDDIPYKLEGELGFDIPYTKPVQFENVGEIRLQAAAN